MTLPKMPLFEDSKVRSTHYTNSVTVFDVPDFINLPSQNNAPLCILGKDAT